MDLCFALGSWFGETKDSNRLKSRPVLKIMAAIVKFALKTTIFSKFILRSEVIAKSYIDYQCVYLLVLVY